MRVITIYPNFKNRGGAQGVALQLAKGLNDKDIPIVLTKTPEQHIISDYKDGVHFESFSFNSVRKYCNIDTVFLSHHRKYTSVLLFFNIFLRKRLNIVHVVHSTFSNLKFLSFFPKKVIAVSNGVRKNLIEYFSLSPQNVKVIFNGIKDMRVDQPLRAEDGKIKILLPARICAVKQQVDLVLRTKRKLLSHIHIYFAGVGEDMENLQNVINNEGQYHYLGYISLEDEIHKYDYICLFSQKEGLPLSLIEGCMFGKPLITNDISSVLDVNEPNETGFVYSDFDSLIEGLNNLPYHNTNEYTRLSENARKRYEDYFTEEKMIARYREVINL